MNAIYLPPMVNDALFDAMGYTRLISIDLHNQDSNRETWNNFRERLQTAKMKLMNLEDIGWLSEDLR